MTRSNKSVRYTIEVSKDGYIRLFNWDKGDTPIPKGTWSCPDKATISMTFIDGARLFVWRPRKPDGRSMTVKWPKSQPGRGPKEAE